MQFTFPLVGVSFRPPEIKTFIASWGDERVPYASLAFALEREPNNQYDENAIKINVSHDQSEPQFCGFVAKEFAEEIAPLLDSGYVVEEIKIVAFQGTYKPILEATISLPVTEDDEGPLDDDESDEAAPASAD